MPKRKSHSNGSDPLQIHVTARLASENYAHVDYHYTFSGEQMGAGPTNRNADFIDNVLSGDID